MSQKTFSSVRENCDVRRKEDAHSQSMGTRHYYIRHCLHACAGKPKQVVKSKSKLRDILNSKHWCMGTREPSTTE